MLHHRNLVAGLVLSLLMLEMARVPSLAQPKPPTLPPANPLAPTLAMPVPSGVQRGTPTEVTLTGANLNAPTGLWLSFPGKTIIPTDDKNGQDPAKLRVKVEVPADAPIGFFALRLASVKGISNIRLFCVDDLPQVVEDGKNTSKATAQQVPLPCVVTGKTDTEAGDHYKFTVQAGQKLSFDLLGRRLGSQLDAQLSIYNAKTQRELAFNNDSPGCQNDPRLSYTFKEAGEYLVEVRDVLNRGGGDFFYRLRVGDFPLATSPLPMAAKAGSKLKVGFAGPNVEGIAPVEVAVPNDPAQSIVWVAPKGANGLSGWPVALAISQTDELLETEPNNEPAKANRVPIPGGITGRFQQSDDLDVYVFAGKKGQKLTIEARTLELNSPTLVYMVVKNAKTGAELAKSNPQAVPPADQRIDFAVPDDGDYLLELQHLNFAGGPSEVYHVSLTPSASAFELTLTNDRYDVSPGAAVPVLVQAVRKGYNGPIDLSVAGSPALASAGVIKAGQNSAVLLVAIKDGTPLGPHAFTVLGKATVDGKPVVEAASGRTLLSLNMANLPYPPVHLAAHAGLAVRETGPISLAAKFAYPEGVPGLAMEVTLSTKREKGFTEEITFNPPGGLPPNVPAPKIPPIPKDKDEVKFNLDLNAKAPVGEYVLLFSGKFSKDKKDTPINPTPLVLALGSPFELKMEPAELALKPGDKTKVKVTAVRKGGYKGPIALEIRKLPANVTAAKASIDMAKDAAEIEVLAAPAAVPVARVEIDVNGTATALNNLANASPPIGLKVDKK